MGLMQKLPFPYRLRLKISQYDFENYSKLTNSVTVELNTEDASTIEFAGAVWECRLERLPLNGNEVSQAIKLTVNVQKGMAIQCNIALECVIDNWSVENYVLMPSAAYNGNRFESRRIAYSPKLLDPRDIGPENPTIITDVPRLNIHDGPSCIDDRSGAMSTPSIGFYAPVLARGFWLLTPQCCSRGDYGYRIAENRERNQAVISISAPVVRELYKYKITDNQYPSDDRAPDWQSGDSETIESQIYLFDCESIQGLFDYWNQIRNNVIPRPEPVASWPFSSTFKIQEKKFNAQNWVEPDGYYSVGMREMFLQDWQIGWTGGMITTYPLLFDGDQTTRERVIRNFDFLFPAGISSSGFFYDCGESKADGFHWYGGDIRKPHTANWHLVRKSGDGIYYILKQFWLMEQLGLAVKPHWKQGLEGVVNAFVNLWKNYGQLGNYVDSQSGEICVGGSTSGGIVPAALAYAAAYFEEPLYRKAAEEIGTYYYHQYVKKGLTNGGVGDAMQNPDSESAYGLLESFAVLYEQTQNPQWLQRAEEMAHQFFSWVVGYNYAFPGTCTLGKLGIKTVGAVFANTQNKHGAPGICTHSGVALLRLFRATEKMEYLTTLRDIVRFIPQLLSHPKRPVAQMPEGWLTERVSTTDWMEGLGEIMQGSTWAETALMLTTVEIPAIYVVPDEDLVVALDAVEASLKAKSEQEVILECHNPSSEVVRMKILCERKKKMKEPLMENYLFNMPEVILVPGETGLVRLKY
jgi:hypothetical protein